MKAMHLFLVLFLTTTAYAGSYVDENGTWHFYKDPPKPDLSKPSAYGVSEESSKAGAAEMAQNRAKWAKQDEDRAKALAEQREWMLKQQTLKAQQRAADYQRQQAEAEAEQARQMQINNQIQAQRLLWGR